MQILALVAALSFAVAGDIYDVTQTERGLKAGVAVEGYTWLVGNKPSAVALYLRDALLIGACIVPSIVAFAHHSAPFYYGFLVAPAVAGIKHIQGGLEWRKLLVK